MKRVISFLKSRPSEVWLGLYAAVLAVVYGTEVPSWAVGVGAVLTWIVTFIASRESNSLGPQP